ncbi:hypothetical protein BN1723_020494, partial [Verticillium longisporum]
RLAPTGSPPVTSSSSRPSTWNTLSSRPSSPPIPSTGRRAPLNGSSPSTLAGRSPSARTSSSSIWTAALSTRRARSLATRPSAGITRPPSTDRLSAFSSTGSM